MTAESGVGQRKIVGRRITFADSEFVTKYTLPFVDATWEVPFVVLDLFGSPPRIHPGPIQSEGHRLRTSTPVAALRRIESVPVSEFGTLAHWDPWWAFRGVSGVDRTWIEGIVATNIARPFRHEAKEFKIHDLRFAEGLGRLEAVIAKDELFRPREFHSGDIDLLALRGKSQARPEETAAQPPAKAL